MEIQIEEKLKEIYKNLEIKVEYKDIREYSIYVIIEKDGIRYESKIIYKYDNYYTLDGNIANIRDIINNKIILPFYYRKDD